MKNLIFITLTVFVFCSCASDGASLDSISKKNLMDSWAWKIFIFTDEGEYLPVASPENKFDNTTKGNSIFVEDVWKINTNDDLFLNSSKVAFKEPIENVNLTEINRKK